jgi:nitrogenase molybdenum-iron protein alpha chain
MGLKPNYIVPYSTIERLEHISEAAATIQICTTLGTYLAAGLEEHFGVPEVKAPLPYGIAGTDACLRELARITRREQSAERVIAREHEKIARSLGEIRKRLAGKKVFIGAGDAHAHSLVAVVRELGMDVAGSALWHYDRNIDNGNEHSDELAHVLKHHGNFPLSICNKQSFELVNQLNRVKPDIFVTRHAGTVWANKLGIPSFTIADEHFSLGYEGIVNFGSVVADTLDSAWFVKKVAKHSKLPYTQWWMDQSPFSQMKEA